MYIYIGGLTGLQILDMTIKMTLKVDRIRHGTRLERGRGTPATADRVRCCLLCSGAAPWELGLVAWTSAVNFGWAAILESTC